MAYTARFKAETPELQPRHAARFYATLSNTVGNMPFTYGPNEAVFGIYPDFPEWKRPSVYRRDVPLPPAVGPLWFREEILAPPQAFAPLLYDLRVDHDDLIPLIPDITSGGGGWPCQ